MTQPDPTPDAPAGPLSGLLVADFSRVLAGPYCTMLLADLGADVIKVESPGGDDTRQLGAAGDRGRRVHLLPGHQPEQALGRAGPEGPRPTWPLAQELARRADVFVQNFKPGGLARFGLDYESVSAANPAIIYASISGFGTRRRQGPARLRPHGAGHVRADEPDRRPGRAAVPGRHLGVRRDRRACTPRSASWPRSTTGPRPARASTSRPT